jgi:hypothetical protein
VAHPHRNHDSAIPTTFSIVPYHFLLIKGIEVVADSCMMDVEMRNSLWQSISGRNIFINKNMSINGHMNHLLLYFHVGLSICIRNLHDSSFLDKRRCKQASHISDILRDSSHELPANSN